MNFTPGFDGPLDLRAHAPGEWVVLRTLTFRAHDGRAFVIPRGFITDLASIPRLVRPALDRNGASRRAAVLHDSLYSRQITSRADADELFDEALELDGAGGLERGLMYAGVRLGGWLYWNQRRNGLTPDDFADLPAEDHAEPTP